MGFSKARGNESRIVHEAEKLNTKVKKIVSRLRKRFDVGYVNGKMLLTKDGVKFSDQDRFRVRGVPLFGNAEWKALLGVDAPTVLNDEMIEAIGREIEPQIKLSLNGEVRTLAGLTNLELISARGDRFHRVYRGIHVSRRDRATLHLYDLSASDDKNALEKAQREYEVIQRLQKSLYLPRILDSFRELPDYPGELYSYSLIDSAASALCLKADDRAWLAQERIDFSIRSVWALDGLHHPASVEDPEILHRNLSPHTVKVRHDGTPLFTDLNYAKLPDAQTVAIQVTEKSPFTSPEVMFGGLGAADVRTDTYALSATLITLFEEDELGAQAKAILSEGCRDRPSDRTSLQELAARLSKLVQPAQIAHLTPRAQSIGEPKYWDEDTVIAFKGSSYRIVSRLGAGGFGITFKVTEFDSETESEFGSYVAKVLTKPEEAAGVLTSYKKVRAYTHPNLATIHEIGGVEDHFAALMKWVEGVPLDDLVGLLPLHADDIGEQNCERMVLKWLRTLCRALGTLHRAGMIHGDVSPKNIIVSGNDVVLTDFDTATEPGGQPRGGTYQYSSSAVQEQAAVSASDDIFALAATMFYAVFDREPFRHGTEVKKESGLYWKGIDVGQWDTLGAFLDRATDKHPAKRFQDGFDAITYLDELLAESETSAAPYDVKAVVPLKPNEVPRLRDLLSAYPGSVYGNAETRGLDSDFAERTYVPTGLDEQILTDIRDRKVNLVILYGNAGDGKTAFLQNLANQLGLPKQHSSERLWDHRLPDGLRVRANLDGSAAFRDRSASDLLTDFFAPFHDPAFDPDLLHLIAVNSGPLKAWLEDFEDRSGATELTQQLSAALNGDLEQLSLRFRFINLNDRSLVGGVSATDNNISTKFLDEILNRFLAEETTWQPCLNCVSANRCTAWGSVRLLKNPDLGGRIRNRLFTALQAVHQRGEVHITARELRASLSYIFFGTHYCTDLHSNPDLTPPGFYERAFDPESAHRQGEVLAELQLLDPALEANPFTDRELLKQTRSALATDPSFAGLRLPSARRLAYFTWSAARVKEVGLVNGALNLHRGAYLERFRRVPLMDDAERDALRDDLCEGIARLGDLPPVAFRSGGGIPVKLTPRTPTETALWVLKEKSRFSLEALLPTMVSGAEVLHTHLALHYGHASGHTDTLLIGAELFHVLLELKEGFQLTDAGSSDIFANLAIFTQRLAQENTREFYAWHPSEDTSVFKIAAQLVDGRQIIIRNREDEGANL